MKLNANALALACAGTFAIVWVICSAIVAALPGMSMTVSGHMTHMQFSEMQWSLGITGLLVGLIAWSFIAGLIGWTIATLYNKLSD